MVYISNPSSREAKARLQIQGELELHEQSSQREKAILIQPVQSC